MSVASCRVKITVSREGGSKEPPSLYQGVFLATDVKIKSAHLGNMAKAGLPRNPFPLSEGTGAKMSPSSMN